MPPIDGAEAVRWTAIVESAGEQWPDRVCSGRHAPERRIGPVTVPEWINIDGSWQARLAGHRWLASSNGAGVCVEASV